MDEKACGKEIGSASRAKAAGHQLTVYLQSALLPVLPVHPSTVKK